MHEFILYKNNGANTKSANKQNNSSQPVIRQ